MIAKLASLWLKALQGTFSRHQEGAAIPAGLCRGAGMSLPNRASRLIQDCRTSRNAMNREKLLRVKARCSTFEYTLSR